MENELQNHSEPELPKIDKVDRVLDFTATALMTTLVLLPQLAYAQEASGAFSGITAFLKSITQLLIFEWGFYIGIITLAIQGYRWKTGRIDLLSLGGWGLGIGIVFFAPNIVGDIRSRASASF